MTTPQQPQYRTPDPYSRDLAQVPHGWQIPQQRQGQGQPPRTPEPRKRRRWPFALLALLALVALVVAGVALAQYQPATPAPAALAPQVPSSGTSTGTGYVPPSAASSPLESEAAPQAFTGTSDQVVTLSAPRDYAVVNFSCPSCKGNVVVKSDEELLVNEIGRYTGKTLYGMSGGSSMSPLTRLQVNARGPWTLTVGGLSTARQVTSPPANGTGDDVLLISSPKDVATLSHTGESNFVVQAATEQGGTDLVVNEIGRYNGTVMLPADGGAMLMAVTADGAWTLS